MLLMPICIEQRPRTVRLKGSRANRRRAVPTGPLRTFNPDGQRSRSRKPEGRRGQDHDRRQPRRQHRRCRLSDAARRPRPAVQRNGCTWAAEGQRAERLRLPLRRPRAGRRGRRQRRRAPRRRPVDAGAGRRERRAAAHRRLRDDPARAPGRRPRALPVHAARLPAVARAADGQRARRRGQGDRPGADRVLRARGARAAARHALADPARAQPAAHRGGDDPDDARRAHAARARRRARGARALPGARLRHGRAAQRPARRGAELRRARCCATRRRAPAARPT